MYRCSKGEANDEFYLGLLQQRLEVTAGTGRIDQSSSDILRMHTHCHLFPGLVRRVRPQSLTGFVSQKYANICQASSNLLKSGLLIASTALLPI